MQCLEAVVLQLLKAVEGERTSSSVYHLLKGKKSSQTIQDAHLFYMTKWFQTASFLKLSAFEQMLTNMLERGWLSENAQRPKVTNQGADKSAAVLEQAGGFPFLSGWQLGSTPLLFFSRLQLLVQVASHFAHQSSAYYPVTREEGLHRWIKSYLKHMNVGREKLAGKLYAEMEQLLLELPEQPDCLLLRFSGASQTGKTLVQTAEQLQMDQTEYWFRFLHALHYAVINIGKRPQQFPLLFKVLDGIYQTVPLTESTRQTLQLLRKNMSVKEIAAVRKLREATIEDHVVELALNDPQFSVRPFIEEEKETMILQAASRLPGRQLKPLKDQLPDCSYFQIRLVLAKESGKSQ